MENIKKCGLAEQVRQFRARFAPSAGALLDDVIPEALLKQWLADEVGAWRERLYGPLTTLKLFIEQVLSADQSCNAAVAQEFSERAAQGKPPCSANNAAYCDARTRMALGLPTRLAKEVGAQLCAKQPATWRWRSREIKLVDGATVSMPDTAENQADFPQPHGQKPGLGFPIARLVAIISLSCGAVLAWAVAACEGKQTGETALLWGLASHFSAGDVVIADRLYTSFFMIALLSMLGVDIVMRQHGGRSTDFRRGRRLGRHDHVVVWARPKCPSWMDSATYATMPETLTLREARVGGWILVSTLIDAHEVTKLELHKLYRLRWQVELDLRAIKEVMQMDVLRCKSPKMIAKEIAVHMAAYNLVRSVMAQAAFQGQTLPRALSFKGALQLLRDFKKNLSHCSRGELAIQCGHMLVGISQRKLPLRPGRVEPRVVKRRPKPRRLLMQPRKILRERLAKKQQRHIAAELS